MSYKTVVLDHALKTKDMAFAVEHKANEMAEKGFELITMSITHSGKAILVFKAPDKPVKTSDDVKGKKSKTEDKAETTKTETAKKNEKTETREDVKKVEKAETVENQQKIKRTNHLTGWCMFFNNMVLMVDSNVGGTVSVILARKLYKMKKN